jgi:hypothetical protein
MGSYLSYSLAWLISSPPEPSEVEPPEIPITTTDHPEHHLQILLQALNFHRKYLDAGLPFQVPDVI